MIVASHLIRQWKVGRIKYPRLCAEKLEHARSFLDSEARKGALPQRPIEEEDSRWWVEFAQPERWRMQKIFLLQCGKVIDVR